MKTLGSTWQDKNDAALPVSRKDAGSTVESILGSYDQGFNSPLRMRAGFPTDSCVWFEPSLTTDADGSKKSLPAIKGIVPNTVQTYLDFQTGANAGVPFVGTWPTICVVGKFRRVAFCYDASQGKMNFAFSAEFDTQAELPNAGGLLNKKFIPCGWIDVICTNVVGWHKSVNATGNTIDAQDVVRFGSAGAGGSGSGIDTYLLAIDASAEVSATDTDLCFVVANESFYRYEATEASAIPANGTTHLAVTSDSNARWVAVSGKYSVDQVLINFTTIAQASAMSLGSNAKLCYVSETKSYYELVLSSLVADSTYILPVSEDVTYRWIAIAGQYNYNEPAPAVGKVYSQILESLGKDSCAFAEASYLDVAMDRTSKTDVSSTAIFDLASKSYKFPVGDEFLTTQNLLSDDFVNLGVDIKTVRAEVYSKNGLVPTLQLSRNGVDLQTVSLVKDGNRFYSDFTFSDEVTDSFVQNLANATISLSGTAFDISASLVNPTYIKSLDLSLVKVADPQGYVLLTIKDSLSNIVFSKYLDSTSLINGINNVAIKTILPSGTYTVGLVGDSIYSSGYPAAHFEINNNAVTLNGRALDLRMKVSGAADLLVDGLACYFGSSEFQTAEKSNPAQEFSFNGDENRTQFEITTFSINKNIKCYDATRGSVYSWDSFLAVNGQTVIFQDGIFQRPNETVKLRFEQAGGIDNSDVNSSMLAAQSKQIEALTGLAVQPYIVREWVPVANTLIVNRAPVENSLKVVGPSERIMFRSLTKLTNEFGPNGEPVWELDNKDARIRCVGSGWFTSSANTGNYLSTPNIGEYIEVVFFGTRLNLLGVSYNDARSVVCSIDGEAYGSNIFYGATASAIQTGRNYTPNNKLQATPSLSLGWHNVKLKLAAVAFNASGIEILNETNGLTVCPGTAIYADKKETLTLMQTSPWKLNFTGTKGGREVKYIKEGVIGTAKTEVDVVALYGTNANHANEEIDKILTPKEFGVQRSDDFSTLGDTTNNRAFTLDDNGTTLTGYQVRISTINGLETLRPCVTVGSFVVLTVKCCGLDIVRNDVGTGTGGCQVWIDGAQQGVLNPTCIASQRREKVCSGLPYGEHTIKFLATSASPEIALTDFIIYKPKKPTLPAKAIELADYCVVADYVQLTGLTLLTNKEKISQGVVRKTGCREMVYVGTWTTPGINITEFNSGFNINTTTSGSYYELLIEGTSFEISTYFGSGATIQNITINGSSNLSAYTCNLVNGSTGLTFNPATGSLTGTQAASARGSLSVTNMPYGVYKVRVTNGNTNYMYCDTIDIITPIIHNNPKQGGTSLRDMRYFSPIPKDSSLKRASFLFEGTTNIIRNSKGISQILMTSRGYYYVFLSRRFKDKNAVSAALSSSQYSVAIGEVLTPSCALITTANTTPTIDWAGLLGGELFGELENEDLRAYEV